MMGTPLLYTFTPNFSAKECITEGAETKMQESYPLSRILEIRLSRDRSSQMKTSKLFFNPLRNICVYCPGVGKQSFLPFGTTILLSGVPIRPVFWN